MEELHELTVAPWNREKFSDTRTNNTSTNYQYSTQSEDSWVLKIFGELHPQKAKHVCSVVIFVHNNDIT